MEEKRVRAAGKLGQADLQAVEARLPAGAARHQQAAPDAAVGLGSVELAGLHGGAGLPAAAAGPGSDKLAGPDSKASTDSLEDWMSPLDGVLGTADGPTPKGCTAANMEQPAPATNASGAKTAGYGAQRKIGVALAGQPGAQQALQAGPSCPQPAGPWRGLSTSQRLRLLLRHYGFRLLGTCLGWAFMDAFYYGELATDTPGTLWLLPSSPGGVWWLLLREYVSWWLWAGPCGRSGMHLAATPC